MSEQNSQKISIRIAIDIPVDIAADTLAQLEPIVARLTSRPVAENNIQELGIVVEDEEAKAHKAEVDQFYADKRHEFEIKCIQAYRILRQITGKYKNPHDRYKVIAYNLGWPVSMIPDVISRRRQKVRKYLKKRHRQTALRLAYDGLSNQQISDHMKVGYRTVSRLIREARSLAQGGVK